MKELSIIIPAYNEEKRIITTLKEYHSFFTRKKILFEIIVVANNCSDNTAAVAKKLKLSNVKILDIARFTGKGGAVLLGFSKAQGSYVSFTDADNSSSPSELYKVFEVARKKKCVAVGSRAVKSSKITVSQPIHRLVVGRIFSLITNTLFGLGIVDTQCGCKVFPSKVARLFEKEKIANGFEFDVQLLWIAKRNGFATEEVGIKWENSFDSKVGLIEPLWMLLGLIKMRLGFA